MALATEDDVAAALGRDLTPTESDAATVLLETASDLVVGYIGSPPDPTPDPVIRVVADMVAAMFTKPAISVADYSATGYNTAAEPATVQVGVESATTTGPWLTKMLKLRLGPYRAGGIVSIGLISDRSQP